MSLIEKLNLRLQVESLKLEDAEEALQEKNQGLMKIHVERVTASINQLLSNVDGICDKMLEENKTLAEIKAWKEPIKAEIAQFSQMKVKLDDAIQLVNEEKTKQKREEELADIQLLEQTSRVKEEERCLNDMMPKKSAQVKLPKLVISKFEGTHIDYQRFWSQFTAEIDNASCAEVTKFSYLKELLKPNVRAAVDGLPFTPEGYARAKEILATRYGRESEVVNAHVQAIMKLDLINGTNPAKISAFYEKLSTHVQALETMGKLREINGYVRMTLDRLPGIRSDLVRTDDSWHEWQFPDLVEALRSWTERNPTSSSDVSNPQERRRERSYQAKVKSESSSKTCAYCDSADHKSYECKVITGVEDRKKLLSEKRLCFNCTGSSHRAATCRQRGCFICKKRHHTSICDTLKEDAEAGVTMCSGEKSNVVYPIVVVRVNGVKTRALLDTGGGSSYASSTLLNLTKSKSVKKEKKTVEMMMATSTQKFEIHDVTVSSIDGSFEIDTTLTKVEKKCLLTVPNPKYGDIIKRYSHLKGVVMEDTDSKEELPVHVVLGISDYTKCKMSEKPRIGDQSQPIAERTKFGWTISSPGSTNASFLHLFHTRSTHDDCESMYRLDVLGIEDRKDGDPESVYDDFKEQLVRRNDGSYETGLIWKVGHPSLPNNKSGSLARLSGLMRKLEREPDLLEKYNNIIQEQIAEGIVEPVTDPAEGMEFYLPHRPVIREDAESTKIRIVMDGSARDRNGAPSLNECLETGPPLQKKIWDILIRNRLKPVALTGDIQKAFLQIHVQEKDRDALRFHWIKDIKSREVQVLRFTRVLFGLVQSPFILGATIQQHLENVKDKYPEIVRVLSDEMYVDDVISGGRDQADALKVKQEAKACLGDGGFTLHKWHSNEKSLDGESMEEGDLSYAKQELGVNQDETAILGVKWNKSDDQFKICFPEKDTEVTKRGIVQYLASIYDPLGIGSPVVLQGKLIFRDACELKTSWDAPLTPEIVTRWRKWKREVMSQEIAIPRCLPNFREPIQSITLHGFGDASKKAISATLYVVVKQKSGTTQGLLTAKTRLAKKESTIPRSELVAAHMTLNMIVNARKALTGYPIENSYCWSDSSTVLYWIKGDGSYKQYVRNRVNKIRCEENVTWRHVPGEENPADIGSRGESLTKLNGKWLTGPKWLPDEESWPCDIVPTPSAESESEARAIKEVLAVSVENIQVNIREEILQKFSYWKSIRISSWLQRFITNCQRTKEERVKGPLTTEETSVQVEKLVQVTQQKFKTEKTEKFEDERAKLRLVEDGRGLLRCNGRIYGEAPIYIPWDTLLSEKLVKDAHVKTLHGGVGLTMTRVREKYWIPRLRQLAKKVRKNCHGCKRFTAVPLKAPVVGMLPRDRTVGERAFQAIGIDYAGPLYYKKGKREQKAYILIYACSLSRALYLDLMPDQTCDAFLRSLKRMIARKGRPDVIYSDNFSTFKSAASWLKEVCKSEEVNSYLTNQEIKWKFNVSKAPWWGGQFERMVALVKSALFKVVGASTLTWNELESLLLDVEITLNNRPLNYVEDDVQMPILTPNSLTFGGNHSMPDDDPENIDEIDLRKRAKYLAKCKDRVWLRWRTEYLTALRERHCHQHGTTLTQLKIGDVVIIKGDEKNRGYWKIGIVTKLHVGTDGITRSVTLRAGKSYLERAVQHLYPLELSCDRKPVVAEEHDDAATEVMARPRRNTAAVAALRIRDGEDDEVEYE